MTAEAQLVPNQCPRCGCNGNAITAAFEANEACLYCGLTAAQWRTMEPQVFVATFRRRPIRQKVER